MWGTGSLERKGGGGQARKKGFYVVGSQGGVKGRQKKEHGKSFSTVKTKWGQGAKKNYGSASQYKFASGSQERQSMPY